MCRPRKHLLNPGARVPLQPDSSRMLREEVTGADVSEVVSRWTGIPVGSQITADPAVPVQLHHGSNMYPAVYAVAARGIDWLSPLR